MTSKLANAAGVLAVFAVAAISSASPTKPDGVTGSITGHVYFSGTKTTVPGIQVGGLKETRYRGEGLTSDGTIGPVTTDRNGKYFIGGLSPSSYFLVTEPDRGQYKDYRRGIAITKVAAGRQTSNVNLFIKRVGEIKGRATIAASAVTTFAGGQIVDQDGNAYVGAVISFTPGPAVVTTTDESGHFMIKNITGRRIHIYIQTSLGHYTGADLICGIADNVIRISE